MGLRSILLESRILAPNNKRIKIKNLNLSNIKKIYIYIIKLNFSKIFQKFSKRVSFENFQNDFQKFLPSKLKYSPMNGSRANIYYKSINEKPRCTSSGICFKNIPRIISSFFSLT